MIHSYPEMCNGTFNIKWIDLIFVIKAYLEANACSKLKMIIQINVKKWCSSNKDNWRHPFVFTFNF